MRRLLLFLCLAIFLLPGCGKNRVAQLSDRTEVFNRSMRWGSLQAAGAFIAEENRKTLMEQLGRDLNKNRIVDFSILDLGLDPDQRKGSVLVEFSYYTVSDQEMLYRQEMQLWQWDSKKNEWFLLEARDLPAKKN